jgi:hypothetical protein
MSSLKQFGIKAMMAGAVLALSMGVAAAAEVAGVKYDDTAKVAGKELQLNGLGVRTKFIIKVYTVGLYLADKSTSTEEIFKNTEARRVRLVMMREVTAEEFGNAFMSGINNNATSSEKTKIVTQISKFGEMFALLEGLKKGDVLDLDWVPGQGTTCYLNGKRIGEVTPGHEFNNAVLKIWLGEKPADSSLKPKLLAGGNIKK